MQYIGPIRIKGPIVNDEIKVPLATYENPLWPSTNRGARVSLHSEGIVVTIIDERMTRSVLIQANDAKRALDISKLVKSNMQVLQKITQNTSRYATLIDVHIQVVARLLYIRLEFKTGDAAGHNMVTKASEHIMQWLLTTYKDLEYVSISANYCTDKKNSAVNGILGRGKNIVAELIVPNKICKRFLKTTPDKMVELNIKKNLIGSIISGGVRTANAHFANMLLAFYLATGQDAANIVEGSQGFVHTESLDNHLYFSVTLPNIIVGTVGHGKNLDFVHKNLENLGCKEKKPPGENARRLAVIAAATVLCGELSLMAAQTNPGELMRAHERLERT
jgi:hydroxymethylglutaryl-CoA reductase (NADPH)